MKKIILIGAGQLGSRHLQAIKMVEEPLDILVVDPSNDSLEITKERYGQVATTTEHKINYSNDLLPFNKSEVFAAVIATSSNVRFNVLSSLVESCSVKNILLEKILFQNEDEYQKALEICEKNSIYAWVNCCMRMQDVYFEIGKKLDPQTLSYTVTGSQYGFVTNAIHYLDHACYLAQEKSYTLDTSNLEDNVIESKRKGFYELNGELSARFSNGAKAHLTCFSQGEQPVLIEISDVNNRYIFKENENSFWVSSKDNGWKWTEQELGFKYQSQLTNIFIESLIKEVGVTLPNLKDSSEIHLNLLKPLQSFLRDRNVSSSVEFPFT